MQPTRKATRKDVAQRAGVSDAVVTYTLNGGAPVAAATARRVLDAVEALGYQPNHAARALKSGSARTIALVFPNDDAPVFTNPFFTEFSYAVELAARQRGYALYITGTPNDEASVVDRFRDFASRQVDGVLIVPGGSLDPEKLANLGVPWLQLNTTTPLAGVDSIGVDLYQGAVDATEHLIAHGYRDIGFIGDIDADRRVDGWRDACRAHGIKPGVALSEPFTREGGYAAGLQLAQDPNRPRAVFAASDLLALGVLRALHENEIRVPEDVALVSFDGSWEAEYSWPALSSVRQPIEAMAEDSIARLLDPVEVAAHHQIYRGELVLRGSCGPHD